MADEKQPEKVRSFDPNKFMSKVSGRDYLPVAGRLVWFREERPDWSIETAPLELNHEKGFAVFRAEIKDETGRVLATGTKHENRHGFADFLEKAETGSVGRALLMLGYGTANALEELDEGARLADSPQSFPNGAQAREGAAAAPQANGKAPVPVKPDAYAVRDRYTALAREAGFQDKDSLDRYIASKGVLRLDRVEKMELACSILEKYIEQRGKDEDPDEADVWEEAFEEADGKEPVQVV